MVGKWNRKQTDLAVNLRASRQQTHLTVIVHADLEDLRSIDIGKA